MSYKPSDSEILITTFQDAQMAHREVDVACSFLYNLHPQMVTQTTANSATISNPNGMAKCTSGTNADGSAKLESYRRIHYNPGFEIFAYFTAYWPDGGLADTDIIIGLYNGDWGFGIGYFDNSFAIGHKKSGSWAAADTVAQADWNGDPLDGTGCSGFTLDKTKGNIFKISMGFLGFAPIRYWVLAGSGKDWSWVNFHTIGYPNNNTGINVQDTALPITMESTKSSAAADDVGIVTGSWCAGTLAGSGHRVMDFVFAASSTKTITDSNLNNIITVRCKSTFNSKTNKMFSYLRHMHAAIDGTKNVNISVWKNATLGGTPSYSDVNTAQSMVEYDTAGTTVTAGILVDGAQTEKVGNIQEEFGEEEYIFLAGETYTFAAQSTANYQVDILINWTERF